MDRGPRIEMTRLMVKLADGDRSAFEPLFALAWPAVRNFAARTLVDPSLGEDAAQAALLKVFERASSFRADGDALTWIITITAYECRTLRKAMLRRREANDGAAVVDAMAYEGSTPEQKSIANNLSHAVREVIADLKDVDRETIMAILEDDARPDLPGATFRKRLERALSRFKGVWEDKHDGHT